MIKRTRTQPVESIHSADIINRKHSYNNSYLSKLEKKLQHKQTKANSSSHNMKMNLYRKASCGSNKSMNNIVLRQGQATTSGSQKMGSHKQYCSIKPFNFYQGYSNKNRIRNKNTPNFDNYSSVQLTIENNSKSNEKSNQMNIDQPDGQAELQNKQQVKPLQHSVIKNLTQFIQYHLNKQKYNKEMNEVYQKQMQQYPLSILEQKVTKSKQKLEYYKSLCVQRNQKEEKQVNQLNKQVKQYEQQCRKVNKQIMNIKEKSHSINNLLKKIQKLEKTKQDKQEQLLKKYQQEEGKYRQKIDKIVISNRNIQETIKSYSEQMEGIKNARAMGVQLSQKIEQTKKVIVSFNSMYNLQIKQKSSKNMKVELADQRKQGQNMLSNKQIVQWFYRSLNKKQSIIKFAIDTHSQYHKFLNNLKLQEVESYSQFRSMYNLDEDQQANQNYYQDDSNEDYQQDEDIHWTKQHQLHKSVQIRRQSSKQQILRLTKQSNILTQQQQQLVNNTPEYFIYKQYLSNEQPYIQLGKNLQAQLSKYQKNLDRIKLQIEQLKRLNQHYEKTIRETDTMEKIREAEVSELEKILQNKNLSLGLMVNHRTSFQNFRDNLAGFAPFKKSISIQSDSNRKKK